MTMGKLLTIRDLYPNLTDQELAEVEDMWDRYLKLVWTIFERLEAEKNARRHNPEVRVPLGVSRFDETIE